VTKTLLVVLTVMSTISWYLIVYKGISQVVRQNRSRKFVAFFWSATSLEEVQNELTVHGVREPFGRLTAHSLHAQAHHAKFGAAKLEETGSEQEFLTRTHQEGARRGDDVARERPHHAGEPSAPHGAVRRPVRHGVGRLSRPGGDRHVGLGHARQGGWARSARR